MGHWLLRCQRKKVQLGPLPPRKTRGRELLEQPRVVGARAATVRRVEDVPAHVLVVRVVP